MKEGRIEKWMQGLLVLGGLALVAVLFVPMWRIDLQAPQYPEGLMVLIYPNKLGGNVDIVNGLNHYIGMKTLHTEDFMEFKILPVIIGCFALLFLVVGLLGRKRWVNILFVLFVCFGVLAMYDFWRWEYDYGHHLNPDAAIIVPGMSYQPPLIGYKQLLNFAAYSMPDIGGWIFVSVGVILFVCVIMIWLKRKGKNNLVNPANAASLLILTTFFSSCSTAPEKLVIGKDNCYSCKMTISDVRYGAEVVTAKGKVYKFDDVHCLLTFLQSGEMPVNSKYQVYLTNFSGDHNLISTGHSLLLRGGSLHSPMNGNIVAFDNQDSLKKIQQESSATITSWKDIITK